VSARRIATLCALLSACSIELEPLDGDAGPAFGGTGGVGGAGDAGIGGSTGGTPCRRYCERVVAIGCNADTISECTDSCEAGATYYARCGARYDAWTGCGADDGKFVCVDGEAIITNCTAEIESFNDCTWNFSPICNVPEPPPSGGGCFVSTGCNPFGGGCASGEVCDWLNDASSYYALKCYPPDAFTAPLCQACNNDSGPFCQPGSSCVGAGKTLCARYCCSDADCGDIPVSCTPLGDTALRFCGT